MASQYVIRNIQSINCTLSCYNARSYQIYFKLQDSIPIYQLILVYIALLILTNTPIALQGQKSSCILNRQNNIDSLTNCCLTYYIPTTRRGIISYTIRFFPNRFLIPIPSIFTLLEHFIFTILYKNKEKLQVSSKITDTNSTIIHARIT